MSRDLKIKNARENNLKQISLDIPHDSFVVATGLSGSGKSSLAFHTVYAEGQRRYVETFSSYTRQFLDKAKRPDVDVIENVRPAIAIQQRTRVTGSRSTVGSMTNINDYLKIVWSNLAKPTCSACGIELAAFTAQAVADKLISLDRDILEPGIIIAAPLVVERNEAILKKEIGRLKILGFSRFIDPDTGKPVTVEDDEPDLLRLLDRGDILRTALDRLIPTEENAKRLRDSIEQAYALSRGLCHVLFSSKLGPIELEKFICGKDRGGPNPLNFVEFREQFGCSKLSSKLPKPRPALFTFNSALGACPECKGFGKILRPDPALCVPDHTKSISGGAIACWAGSGGKRRELQKLIEFCKAEGISTSKPWAELKEEDQQRIFAENSKKFRGLNHWFKKLERKAYKMHVRVFMAKYRGQFDCALCGGSRLVPDALAYKVRGRSIAEIWSMPIGALLDWFETLRISAEKDPRFSRELGDVFKTISSRLKYLSDLGLPYLTLDRQARTLSGGETQRVNLAGAIGSELVSTHFVLDEPSVGLHARDSDRLIQALRALQIRGNSLLVVEHDLDCIAAADHIIELGPGAGERGGEAVYNGPVSSWEGIDLRGPANLALSGHMIPAPTGPKLKIKNAQARNLKNISADVPLGRFTVLTGVSGSGKSTLASEIIFRAFEDKKLGRSSCEGEVIGLDLIKDVRLVDQSPLAKSPRSNIATYSGIWDDIRSLLSGTDAAKARKLSKSSFSFNVDAGRCPACSGAGYVREDMQFLSDVYIPCELCLGARFQPIILEVAYRGKSVDDFLKMSVEGAAEFFSEEKSVQKSAAILTALGLGHLRLGHPLSELSGGEAQRLKLMPYLQGSEEGESLLIFDEPTTGLHVNDIAKLISLFRDLRAKGHTVLCVEHNLTLIRAADWIIDLGKEGGLGGGELVLSGTPEKFLAPESEAISHTAKYLRRAEGSLREGRLSADLKKAKILRAESPRSLKITGAREHNLKNLDVDIPLQSIVAITGVSGSGKSTIAKDIVYAEGQRRYLDCLSPYARQFIKELKKPDIGSIKNVKPTICVYQHTFQPGRLSTVATMSEVYNYLRLLYAKTAAQYCPDHPSEAISPVSPESIAEEIMASKSEAVRILAPVIKMKKGTHQAVIQRAEELELTEIRVDGLIARPRFFEEKLVKTKPHTIEYVIGRFSPKRLDPALVKEAVTQALGLGGGTLILLEDRDERVLSIERSCPVCKKGFFKPDPEDLSFHSKRGRCQSCEGTGLGKKGAPCADCEGSRLNPLARHLKIDGKNINEACALPPSGLSDFLDGIRFDSTKAKIALPVMRELSASLKSLIDVGLDYIPLGRECSTLSGGELQRLRLAAAMGSPLTDVLYIFDEPSAGLHPDDNESVLKKLRSLKAAGNSVLIIEHDPASILAADSVIDVGPGGGRNGGEIVYSGPAERFISDKKSSTARHLAAKAELSPGQSSRSVETISIESSSRNNIHGLSLSLPLNALTTVAGVSGAGKSSLVHGIVGETLSLGKKGGGSFNYLDAAVSSTIEIARVLTVDQKPIGKNSRSTPASYLGIWDEIRKLFAGSIEAKSRGWRHGDFSYNTGKGRCPTCKGQGFLKLEMNFLADAEVICEACGGGRFNEAAGEIKYLGLSISEVLNLTFDEAKTIFANHKKIHQVLHQACELGLGYLTLGQGSGTLSGGESQRIKIVEELGLRKKGHTLYILDEPTTGLHKADVARLMRVLRALVDQGNTVILIEHDSDVIAQSDNIVELGPGAGELGGRVIYDGPPIGLLKARTPWGKIFQEIESGLRLVA